MFAYLQSKPELVSIFDILLVEHPKELHYVGVIRKSLEDVVLGFNLLIDVLRTASQQVECSKTLDSAC